MADKSSNNKNTPRQKMTKAEIKREIMEWVLMLEIAIVIAVAVNMLLIVNAVIPSASMEPTIMTGDRIFGNRLAYRNEDPQRGDIVIFRFPDDESQLFIKRIIGLPGDTVEVKDGLVFINGSETPLDEPYVKVDPIGDYGPVEVPLECYFMMGDNRNCSADSRFWQHPFVRREKILGKAAFRYFREIGTIE